MMGKASRLTCILIAVCLVAFPLGARQRVMPTSRAVMVAGNGDLDACLSTATVRELKPARMAFLSVRAAPNIKAPEADRIRAGHVVWDCDVSPDWQWVGIVYHPGHRSTDMDDADVSCDFPPNGAERHGYQGNCRTGWVAARYLINLAG